MEYGKHYLVEVVTESPRNLGSKKFIESFILKLIKTLSMTKLGKPAVFKFPYPGGITGFCVISESHISIHTWPEKNYFSLDVFSCRNFDEQMVKNLVHRNFKVKKYFSDPIARGLSVNFRN